MEKINIAELLKNCPEGMELDCTVYDECVLDSILENEQYPIKLRTPEGSMLLSKYGSMSYSKHAKCIIFPKGKTTWKGFQIPFKDGDILVSGLGNPFIFKELNGYNNIVVYCALNCYSGGGGVVFDCDNWTEIGGCRFAAEEEKEKLFQAIKANGYKWNAETKTLEKLVTIFKVGDKIKLKNSYAKKYDDFNTRKITEIEHSHYILDDKAAMPLANQYLYELVPNKFDITTLVPFESRVLVRDNVGEKKWKLAIWGYYDADHINGYPYEIVGGNCFCFCIPYEGNEHLLGTANDCDDFYKTWQK